MSVRSDNFDDIDYYAHPVSNVFYTPINIPGPGADASVFNEQYLGCCCKNGNLCIEYCSCIDQFGENYQSGRLLESKLNGPVIECNSACTCSSKCSNRVVQKGPIKTLQVIPMGGKGLGVITDTPIEKLTFVCEYAGEVIGLDEAKKRTQLQLSQKGMNYIFVLREHIRDQVMQTCVDPTYIGNIGRYVNHSCESNTVIVPVRVNNSVPKLCLFSKRLIVPNEEITFDYGNGMTQNTGGKLTERKRCMCGATTCREFLPFDNTLF